jgi:predicted RNA-binding Zn ribbon-like protein
VQFDRFDNRAARLGAAIVDAAACGLDRAALQAVLDDHDMPVMVTDADLPTVQRLADDLARVFVPDGDVAVAALDGLLAQLEVRPRITTHDGRPPHLHYEPDGADAGTRLRVNTLMGVAAVVAHAGPDRLGCCEARGCDRVFVDVSRNGRRRFCSNRCANRAHVAAHRARRRDAVGA